MKDNRIAKQIVVEKDEKFTYANFSNYISDGCYKLDIATPVIIKSHIFNFAKYNRVKFLPSDFIEKVEFDNLIAENLEK